jgi:hypothetical protein
LQKLESTRRLLQNSNISNNLSEFPREKFQPRGTAIKNSNKTSKLKQKKTKKLSHLIVSTTYRNNDRKTNTKLLFKNKQKISKFFHLMIFLNKMPEGISTLMWKNNISS